MSSCSSQTGTLPTLDMFALDSDDDSSINSEQTAVRCDRDRYSSLDACLCHSLESDCMPVTSLIRGLSSPKKRLKTVHLRPVAYVRFNTSLGKPKPVTLTALLDSGAAETLICKKHVKKLRLKQSQNASSTWTTPAGPMRTNSRVKSTFTLPELHSDRLLEWNFHVADDLGAYDIIIGRDILKFLGVAIDFETDLVSWDGRDMPFKDMDLSILENFHIADDENMSTETDRIQKILDAKYEKADLTDICNKQTQLQAEQREKLLTLLRKHEPLFDGTLGKWTGTEVELELNEGATPYHARAFPVPRVHLGTLKNEVERLCRLGVLKRVNRSQWAAPTFCIPKKDGAIRFISDFRELNKRIKRRPYPIPHIQDMLTNLEGFQYATSLDLNMGYYHLELSEKSKELCTIVLPFGKFEYQRIPMGLCNSPDIFQEKMNELFEGLDFVRAYIDDLLCLTSGTFEDHLEKVDHVLTRLGQAGLKVNAKKSFFARGELEYLGYWITRDGIQPMKEKVEAMMHIAEPKNRKELRSFIGVVNYYRDMWVRRSHVLAPLASLTSNNTKWEWGPKQSAAFRMAKRIMAKETILAYPDFSKKFTIHTDASHYQLGGVISQEGKPIAFYSRKLNDAQTRYTTTERELLSIVETLKAYRNILLGHEIEVHTDHKNLVYKTFNTERVMRWRLIIEEFGPKLLYIKGENNVVADALSRLGLKEEDFSLDAFAFANQDVDDGFPLTYAKVHKAQQEDQALLDTAAKDKAFKTETYRHSDKQYDLLTENGKIYVPKALRRRATEWYHQHLMHPGETRMELTIGAHFHWRNMRDTIQRVCRACVTCKQHKKRTLNKGILPAKKAEVIPWHTLCIDLIGPYTIGKTKQHKTELWALTMIDPATGWFDIVQIKEKRPDYIANHLEIAWLSRYPWPTEIVMDRGSEFAREVEEMILRDYGITKKLITTRNPQANAILERVHQTVHNLIRSQGIKDKRDLCPVFGWDGVLSAVRHAVNATVHTTLRATPTQLVFGRDAMLNISFQADWEYIRDRKQKLIVQNNKRENATRVPHTYSVGDKVMVKQLPNRKHGEAQFVGPLTVTKVNDNGTVQLKKASSTKDGAVYQTWNVRNLDPCKD